MAKESPMPDTETTVANGAVESPEGRRARQAAEDVAAWEAAFAAANASADDRPTDPAQAGV
jgi:hypothetical protein